MELMFLQSEIGGWYAGSVLSKEEAGLPYSSTTSSHHAYSLPTRLFQYPCIEPLLLDGFAEQPETTRPV